jgi:hypothetical protein
MKAALAPRITTTGLPGFLLWARRDNPALYSAMVAQLPEVAAFEGALRAEGVSGIMDVLSSFGNSLANSAKKVGAFVAKNALPIAAAAVPLLVAKKQADIAKAQMKLADAQMAPMQTAQYQSPEGVVTMPVQMQNGQWQQVPVSGGMIGAQVATGGAQGIPKWVWLAGAGGAALLLAVMLRR